MSARLTLQALSSLTVSRPLAARPTSASRPPPAPSARLHYPSASRSSRRSPHPLNCPPPARRAMSTSPREANGVAPPAAGAAGAAGAPQDELGPVVQYVVIRRDLGRDLGWPMGSIIAQGCHASVAAAWQFKDDEVTQDYCSPEKLAHMHKVVLEIKGEPQLLNLAKKLDAAGVKHYLWQEQPENFPTALATKPYHKNEVAGHFKKLNLAK